MLTEKDAHLLDPRTRDQYINSISEDFEQVSSTSRMEEENIRQAYTCLELLHAIIVNSGNTAIQLACVRNWRTLMMSRVGEKMGNRDHGRVL